MRLRRLKRRIKSIKFKKEKAFWCAAFAVLLMTGVYFYALQNAAFNAVKITKIERETAILNQNISRLEFEMIALKNDLNTELAYSLGFEESQDTKFIQKRSVATILNVGNIQ